ncbi:MAG: hypothetical protein ACM3SQ_10595 [Betaproteobacteria bacterium]
MPKQWSAHRLLPFVLALALASLAAPSRGQDRTSGGTNAPGRAADAKTPIVVRTSLDRTAVWVADHVTYGIDVACARGVDILDEDLAKDKLKLEGLDLLASATSVETATDGTTIHHFRYTLTTYQVDRPALTIAPLSLRYYVRRPGQRLEDAAPAGEVEVPAAVIAYRSMLPDAQDSYDLRDAPPPQVRPRRFALAQPVGLGLVIASIVPFGFVAAAAVRRRGLPAARRSARQVHEDEQATLEALRALDLTTAEGRRAAYSRMNELVRQHLREACDVAGQSLTPAEVEPALAARATSVPAGSVTALLAACELARYAPPDALPSADQCRTALDQTAEILAAR